MTRILTLRVAESAAAKKCVINGCNRKTEIFTKIKPRER